MVVGRQGGRGGRQDGGAQQQGDRRVGQVHAAFWKDAHDEGGLGWDDTNNNRAFLSRTISATINAASIYIEACASADQYKTEKGAPLKDDIQHAAYPKGPAGQSTFHTSQSHMMHELFEEPEGGQGLSALGALQGRVREVVRVAEGLLATPPPRDWAKHAVWDEDPVMLPFKDGSPGSYSRLAGPANAKSAEVLSKYIITDMYAKAVQGMPAEDAVKWAESELKKIYV